RLAHADRRSRRSGGAGDAAPRALARSEPRPDRPAAAAGSSDQILHHPVPDLTPARVDLMPEVVDEEADHLTRQLSLDVSFGLRRASGRRAGDWQGLARPPPA